MLVWPSGVLGFWLIDAKSLSTDANDQGAHQTESQIHTPLMMLQGQHQCLHQTDTTQPPCVQQAIRPGNARLVCLVQCAELGGYAHCGVALGPTPPLSHQGRSLTCFLFIQPIMVRWILRPLRFLQILPHKQVAHVIDNPLFISCARKSVHLGYLFFPPLRHPWGYLSDGLSVPWCGCSLTGAAA